VWSLRLQDSAQEIYVTLTSLTAVLPDKGLRDAGAAEANSPLALKSNDTACRTVEESADITRAGVAHYALAPRMAMPQRETELAQVLHTKTWEDLESGNI
jgi:hypothetical protein